MSCEWVCMCKDAISNSLIVFRFSWDLVAEAKRSRRCASRIANSIDYRMKLTPSFIYPTMCLSSQPTWSATKGKIMFMAAASLKKSPFSWHLKHIEVAETVNELWITWLCDFRICLLVSPKVKVSFFICSVFSQWKLLSHAKSGWKWYGRGPVAKVSDRRPAAAEPWRQLW